MMQRQWGRIINVASISGLHASVHGPHYAPYAASKAGLMGLTREIAASWGRQGIRVDQQSLMLRFILPFHVITALLPHLLRQHAEMAQKRNARADDRADLVQNLAATFRLDGLSPGGDQTLRIFRGLLGSFVALIRQIRYQ